METQELEITSSAFEHEAEIPAEYTCDGEEINPPLHIAQLPENTVTLALIAEDPDASKGIFDHWIVWNIDPVNNISANSRPGISGKNGAGKTGYHGPCPPSGVHRYFFYVFALDTEIDLPSTANKADLQNAIKGHIIGQGHIMGRYGRNK